MEKRRLGRIGHETSVLVYGAAALGDVTQETADASLTQALDAGINHLDTAASYGEAELRMGPTVERIRDQVFLATKSTERRAEDAWRELNRSLELLHTDHIDLWQIHGVCDLPELDKVFAPGGAIEAFVRAKDEGIVSWVGITGHTEQAPVVHAEALRRHDFDSVLTPVNYHLYTADDTFRANFDILYGMAQDRDPRLARDRLDRAQAVGRGSTAGDLVRAVHRARGHPRGDQLGAWHLPVHRRPCHSRRDHTARQGHRRRGEPHGPRRGVSPPSAGRRLLDDLRLSLRPTTQTEPEGRSVHHVK